MRAVFTYSDIDDYKLEEAEEVELIARAQAGDNDAVDRLIMAYGPTIRAAVSNFANGVRKGRDPWAADYGMGTSAFTEEDAQHTAIVGFMEAIREHDPAKSPRLAGTIKTRIARELADLYETVMPFRVPERTLSRFYGILQEADGDPDLAESLAPEHAMSVDTFREIYSALRNTGSLYEGEGDETGPAPAERAKPVFTPSPVVDVEDRILVDAAFSALDDEEARIVELSYGFTEPEPLPDKEVAHRVGLTRPTAQRRRAKALDKMRKKLGVTLGVVEETTSSVTRRTVEGGEVREYASGVTVEVRSGRKFVEAPAGLADDGVLHRSVEIRGVPYAACSLDRSRPESLVDLTVGDVECSACRRGL